MEKIKLLVIDDNVNLVNMVTEYFSKTNNIEVVFTAYNGEEGINVAQEQKDKYDVMLLDLIMPKKDGMYVLQEMKKRGINKNVIVATSYNANEIIREVSELGVNYFILKPFDLCDLEKRILDIMDKSKGANKSIDLHHNNLNVSITKVLHELGIPSHIKGYQYIREAIGIIFERPETSWNRGDWDLMEEIFGHSVDIDKAKPTNSEFIVTIADKLRLDYHKVC